MCEVCSAYGVQTVAIKLNKTNTLICFTCLDERNKNG